jgi:hypothetical protein
MRCKEVKRLIDKKAEINEAMTAHIKTCPECARALEAASLMQKSLKTRSDTKISETTPLFMIRQQIEKLTKRQTGKVSIMAKIKSNIKTRPKLITGFGVALIAIFVLTIIPFSYTVTVGYDLEVKDLDDTYEQAKENYVKALDVLGYEKSEFKKVRDKYVVTNLPNERAVLEASYALSAVTGYSGEADVNPVRVKKAATLYAQAKDVYVSTREKEKGAKVLSPEVMSRIKIDIEGQTDEEIKRTILAKLEELGLEGVDIMIRSSGNKGDRFVGEIKAYKDSEEFYTISVVLKDIDDLDVLEFRKALEVELDVEGKSDEEIETMLKERFDKNGYRDVEIRVETDENGRKRAVVKLKEVE